MSCRNISVVAILLLTSGMTHAADGASIQGTGNASRSSGMNGLGSTWADAAKMPDLFTGTWWNFASFVEGDPKLNVPFTPKAQKYVDSYKHKRDISYAEDGCKSPGLPIAMRLGGGIKFTYAPGLLSIYMQSVSDTRFVKLNEKPGKTSPKFYGNSFGHWEGDILVVETVDFLPGITFQYGVGKPLPPEETRGTFGLGPPPGAGRQGGPARAGGPSPGEAGLTLANLSAAIWGPYGEGMHMVERMRLIDRNTMEIQTTMYDDTVWTQPYVMAPRRYTRLQKGIREMGQFTGDAEEYVCSVSVTIFDPDKNTYVDKDPEEIVKILDRQGN
jgi:hypothetical protein